MLRAWEVTIDDYEPVIVHEVEQEDAVRAACYELKIDRSRYESSIQVRLMQRIYDGSYVPAA